MARPVGLPDALKSIEEVRGLVGDRPSLFLDYDGTLTPIVARPRDAATSERVRNALAELARWIPVAVVSGRGAADVAERVGVAGLIYAGSHGLEIDFPDGSRFEHKGAIETVGDLDRMEADLAAATAQIGGSEVERKPFAIAVHTRNVGSQADRDLTEEVVRRLVARADRLVVRRGKEVFEVRPAVDWDKGATVGHLLRTSAVGTTPIFIGDDDTDEDGFRGANEGGGIGILVGGGSRGTTAARYVLASPATVVRFLELL